MARINIFIIFIILLCFIINSPLCFAGNWDGSSNIDIDYQKMLSSIEYKGDGQFKHQVESFLTIQKEQLSNERKRYSIYSNDLNSMQINGQQNPVTFVIDDKSGQIVSDNGSSLTMLEKVNNNCVKVLQQEETKGNIGRTWKQSFDLSIYDYSLPEKLTFTMSAIGVKTDKYGKMIAVRALSEPFKVNVINSDGKIKEVKSRIRSAYLFDQEIDEIYLSMSVFDAAADINSKNEKLRHEIATYKTDADGNAVNLKGLGKDFEKYVQKVGLTNQDFKVKKETTLPQWAQSEGLRAFQVCNACAALSCEGGLNPVTTLTISEAQIVSLQSTNRIVSAQQVGSIGSILAQNVPALGGMKIAMVPAAGAGIMSAGSVSAVLGATAGGVAIVENNSHGSSSVRSPIAP